MIHILISFYTEGQCWYCTRLHEGSCSLQSELANVNKWFKAGYSYILSCCPFLTANTSRVSLWASMSTLKLSLFTLYNCTFHHFSVKMCLFIHFLSDEEIWNLFRRSKVSKTIIWKNHSHMIITNVFGCTLSQHCWVKMSQHVGPLEGIPVTQVGTVWLSISNIQQTIRSSTDSTHLDEVEKTNLNVLLIM